MRDKAILENGVALKFVIKCYKDYKLSNRATANNVHWLEFVSNCYKSQKNITKLSILLFLL